MLSVASGLIGTVAVERECPVELFIVGRVARFLLRRHVHSIAKTNPRVLRNSGVCQLVARV